MGDDLRRKVLAVVTTTTLVHQIKDARDGGFEVRRAVVHFGDAAGPTAVERLDGAAIGAREAARRGPYFRNTHARRTGVVLAVKSVRHRAEARLLVLVRPRGVGVGVATHRVA